MRSTLTGLIFAISLFSEAHAESLSYSGRLVNNNGSPVSGTPTLRFELASTLDTSAILCSDQITGVPLNHGVFHVKIDLDCGGPSLSQKLHEISLSGKEAVLRVINVDASKTYSFQEMHAVPKASLSSFSAEALQLSQNGATSGQLLAWDGAKWAPVTPGGASSVGSVTSIIAGAGLSGGTITTSGTIAIANSGVTDAHLAGNIARSKLANGTPNYVLVNDGAGALSGLAQLSIALGGTGASTAAGARTNLGLGSAAIADIGTSAGNVMSASGVPSCLPFEKLQMSVGPTYVWTCAIDADSLDSTKLPLAGGTMAGAINMGGNQISNLPGPSLLTDAATKGYVDTQLGTVSSSQWTTSGSNIYYNTGNVGIGASTPVSKLHITGKLTIKPDAGTPSTPTADAVATFDREAGPVAINLFTSTGNTASVYFGDTSSINTGAIKYLVHSGVPTSQQMDFFVNNANRMSITGNGTVDILGTLRLKSDTANTVNLRAPASLASTLTMSLPGTAGTSGQALITDGAGNLSWASVATGASAVGGDLTGTVTNAQIAAGAIVDADIAAGAAIDQSKINGLGTSLSGKEPTITAGTTAQYWRGDKSWQTLNTATVPESTNLYFTEPRVLGTDLAGYSATTGAITAADTVLSAIGKLSGNLAATSTAQGNYVLKAGDTMSGALAMGNNKITGLATPTVGTDAATMAYVDSKVAAAPGDNLGNHTATTTLALATNNITGVGKISLADGAWNSPSYTFTSSATSGFYYGGGSLGFSLNGALVMNLSSNALALNGSYAGYIRNGATVWNAASPTYTFGGDTDTGIFNVSTNILGFSTAGVERMRIIDTGDVGIGTNAPAAKLDVAGGIKMANDTATCNASKQGTMRFVSGNFQGCDGTSWVTMGSATPAGQVATYAMTSCPAGWIKANGAAVSRITYASLFTAVGTTWGAGDGSTTFNLPDLRGEFVRGLDDGRGVDTGRAIASAQADDNKSHTHTATTSSDGNHAHTGSTSSDGNHAHSGNTSTDGWHGHGVNALYPWDNSVFTTNDWSTDALLGTDNAPGGNGFRSTNQGTEGNGNHAHNLNINAAGTHGHTFTTSTTGAHSHTLTTAASGGAETRPRNQALLYCIKI